LQLRRKEFEKKIDLNFEEKRHILLQENEFKEKQDFKFKEKKGVLFRRAYLGKNFK